MWCSGIIYLVLQQMTQPLLLPSIFCFIFLNKTFHHRHLKENAKEQGQRKATHREPERSWSTVRKTAMIKKLGKKFFNILFRLFKKLLSDRNKTLDELQQTQSNLQKNIPKIVKKPNTPRAAVVGAPPPFIC